MQNDDFIMCEKHNFKRVLLDTKMVMGRELKVYKSCPYCLSEKEKIEKEYELKKLYDKLDSSNVGRKYYPLTFKNIKIVSPSFKIAKERAEKYCINAKECFDRGLGIYFFGDNGRGKTAIISCMFKELIKKDFKPYITTMNELQNNIINKKITLNDVMKKQFLCIDDIGTENYLKNNDVNWTNELLFDIVSYRDKNMLPTLFTSNHEIADLWDIGLMTKTIERISALSSANIEIKTPNSFRDNKVDNIPF